MGMSIYTWASLSGSAGKNLPIKAEDMGSIPWRRKWQLTPVFLPGNSHGQWSLGGYSPWSHKESDMTEATKQQLSACGPESWATGACHIPRHQRLILLPMFYGIKGWSVSQRLFLGTLVQ